MIGKKARRGAPLFGLAWDLDEEAIFHGGPSRAEVSSADSIQHEQPCVFTWYLHHMLPLFGFLCVCATL